MSNLKHLNAGELLLAKNECKKYITNLKSKLAGQQSRLEWIEKYLFEKTPQELSMAEIESRLGHKVIIKGR